MMGDAPEGRCHKCYANPKNAREPPLTPDEGTQTTPIREDNPAEERYNPFIGARLAYRV